MKADGASAAPSRVAVADVSVSSGMSVAPARAVSSVAAVALAVAISSEAVLAPAVDVSSVIVVALVAAVAFGLNELQSREMG